MKVSLLEWHPDTAELKETGGIAPEVGVTSFQNLIVNFGSAATLLASFLKVTQYQPGEEGFSWSFEEHVESGAWQLHEQDEELVEGLEIKQYDEPETNPKR